MEYSQVIEVNDVADAVNELLQLCPDLRHGGTVEEPSEFVEPDEVVITNEMMVEEESTECVEPNEVIIPDIGVVESEEILNSRSARKRYYCQFCNRGWSKRALLNRHLQSEHDVKEDELFKRMKNIKCAFNSECGERFHRLQFYREHLKAAHGVELEKVVMTFNTYKEFWEWKIEEQDKTASRFNKFFHLPAKGERGELIRKKGYLCCRSGRSHGKQYKKMTRKEIKIDSCCPAMMEVMCYPRKFVLTYYKTHVGHGDLNEVLVSSLKKRKYSAWKRQQRLYQELKLEIRKQLDDFITDVAEDKFSYDFLKLLSKKFGDILNPDSWRDDYLIQGNEIDFDLNDSMGESKESTKADASFCSTESPYLESTNASSDVDVNGVNIHLESNDLFSEKRDEIPVGISEKSVSKRPIVIYASREIVKKPCKSKAKASTCRKPRSPRMRKKGNRQNETDTAPASFVVIKESSLKDPLPVEKGLQFNSSTFPSTVGNSVLRNLLTGLPTAPPADPYSQVVWIPVQNAAAFGGKPLLPKTKKFRNIKPNQEGSTPHSKSPGSVSLQNSFSKHKSRPQIFSRSNEFLNVHQQKPVSVSPYTGKSNNECSKIPESNVITVYNYNSVVESQEPESKSCNDEDLQSILDSLKNAPTCQPSSRFERSEVSGCVVAENTTCLKPKRFVSVLRSPNVVTKTQCS